MTYSMAHSTDALYGCLCLTASARLQQHLACSAALQGTCSTVYTRNCRDCGGPSDHSKSRVSRSRVYIAEGAKVRALVQRPQPVEYLHRPLAEAPLGELLQQCGQGTRIQPTKPDEHSARLMLEGLVDL